LKKRNLIIGVALALLLTAVIVTPVMAADDTTTVSGTVPSTLEITEPGDWDIGTLSAETKESTGLTCGIASNDSWTVSVEDAVEATGGHMKHTTETDKLTNSMHVKTSSSDNGMGSDVNADLAWSGTKTTTQIGEGTGNGSFGVTFSQEVITEDLSKTAGTYQIVVTFIASTS
jgi:hypothetical protein